MGPDAWFTHPYRFAWLWLRRRWRRHDPSWTPLDSPEEP